MVVITIIAVLAGFSVPAISGALDRSNQTKDLNNIKQLAHVLFMDANDHSGSFRGINASTNTNSANNATDIFKQLLDEKVLSIIIEFIVPSSRMKEILEALKSCAAEIDTVFSVGLVDRVSEDGSMENAKRAGELGYLVSVNAKVNVGLGRPLAKS